MAQRNQEQERELHGKPGPEHPLPKNLVSERERESVRRITDVETLKAIAHPLRVQLLGELRLNGPATASELARRCGESSGATSYHLRQLERYGFVEDELEQRSKRQRTWRAVHQYTSWTESELSKTAPGKAAAAWLRQRQR